ncbi:helix-turn-helix domain-containing protein [Saccharicrinis fermentans]|uniref:Putative transcriptional regulator n=1 Tax=Saccharicrinis fermentans DSM 9555 = JCM 21142 TaxID=869213 RepID=W7XVT1_9BACT|nr:helix-turn-helix domain-containing protein [Saccharicrinis fermentans]GAF02320.1 putative transcriptional regulator [Saccharicrinis fermentans DSM 9555 = JCM 21142]
MLKYNFRRIFRARGIEKPHAYLRKAGFSVNFATKVKNNNIKRLDLKELEKLCLLLRCTPNDFMEWMPDPNTELSEKHPMNDLKKPANEVDFVKTLSEVPLGKLEELNRLLKEHLGK